jgi:hypothetical protein
MSLQQQNNSTPSPAENLPWYRQFWPWFIIALPASAVIAGFITLWLAMSRPDHLVVDDEEYRRIKSELKAQAPEQDQKEKAAGPDSSDN